MVNNKNLYARMIILNLSYKVRKFIELLQASFLLFFQIGGK